MGDFYTGIAFSQFYNNETLNIFCDASIIKENNSFTGCYGAVAVCQDNVIDSIYRIASDSTNNNSEIKGIRCALSLANKYKDNFKFINIFSDSMVSVMGLTRYIYNWKYNQKDGVLYSSSGKPVANQSIFIECYEILMNLELYTHGSIRMFHQSGHVGNGYKDICDAAEVFRRMNNLKGKIDLNFIRYISTYNNYIDQTSRSLLRRTNTYDHIYSDPIYFEAKGSINKIIK